MDMFTNAEMELIVKQSRETRKAELRSELAKVAVALAALALTVLVVFGKAAYAEDDIMDADLQGITWSVTDAPGMDRSLECEVVEFRGQNALAFTTKDGQRHLFVGAQVDAAAEGKAPGETVRVYIDTDKE